MCWSYLVDLAAQYYADSAGGQFCLGQVCLGQFCLGQFCLGQFCLGGHGQDLLAMAGYGWPLLVMAKLSFFIWQLCLSDFSARPAKCSLAATAQPFASCLDRGNLAFFDFLCNSLDIFTIRTALRLFLAAHIRIFGNRMQDVHFGLLSALAGFSLKNLYRQLDARIEHFLDFCRNRFLFCRTATFFLLFPNGLDTLAT